MHIIAAGELKVVQKHGLRFCLMAAAFWNIGSTISMLIWRAWSQIVAKIDIVKTVDSHMVAAAISAAIIVESYI